MRCLEVIVALLLLISAAYAQDNQPALENPAQPGTEKSPASETEKILRPEEISSFVRLLGSRFMKDRTKAQAAIARAGEAVIPYLQETLRSKNSQLRMGAVGALGQMKRPAAIPHILNMLTDSNLTVRRAAAKAIERYGVKIFNDIDKLVASGKLSETSIPDHVTARIYQSILRKLFGEIDRGGHYPGQYEKIVKLGTRAVPGLLYLLDRSLIRPLIVNGGSAAVIEALSELKDDRVIKRLKSLWDQTQAQLAELRKVGRTPRVDNWIRMLESRKDSLAVALAILGVKEPFNEMVKPLLEQAKKTTGVYARLALFYHRAADYDESQKWYRRAAKASGSNPVMHYNLACALAMGKKLDEAVEALKTAIEKGYQNFGWMMKDRELDPIRQKPAYLELLKKHCPQFLPKNKQEKKQQDLKK